MQIEMTIKLMVDPITNLPIILLRDRDGQRVLPIWVGAFEANAIALQIENITTPRPMTHDLLRNVIHDLKAEIRKIVVSDLKDNTFYALIHLEVNGEPLAVDARPSDAIALALRARAPIFVEDRVIDNAKTNDFAPDKTDAGTAPEVAREPRSRRDGEIQDVGHCQTRQDCQNCQGFLEEFPAHLSAWISSPRPFPAVRPHLRTNSLPMLEMLAIRPS